MDTTQLLSTIFKLKASVDYISKQGILPYSPILSYKSTAVVVYKQALWVAKSNVPIGNPPISKSPYWKNVTDVDVGIISVKQDGSKLIFTYSDSSTQVIEIKPAERLIEPPTPIKDGKDGLDGEDGVGIRNVSQNGDTVLITLTDGNSYTFTLPKASPLQPHSITNIIYQDNSFVIQLSDESSYSVPVELPKGAAATIKVGEVVTVEHDQPSSVENVGDENNAILDFRIAKGKDAVSVQEVVQVDQDTIKVILTDGTDYTFKLPKGVDGKDADEDIIVNTVFEKLSSEIELFRQHEGVRSELLREELQSLVDYNTDDVEGKLSDSFSKAISNLPRITTEDVSELVRLALSEYKYDLEQERQEGLAELKAFVAKY